MSRVHKQRSNKDRVCVGRGQSAGGVGVSAAAGCACRPAPSAVSAGAKNRVSRREVPCRPPRGCVGRRRLSRPQAFCVGRGGLRAQGFHKEGKRIPALTQQTKVCVSNLACLCWPRGFCVGRRGAVSDGGVRSASTKTGKKQS